MATLCITGRLGGDAEVRSLQSNTKVTNFSVACDQGWGDKKTTLWVKCAMFGERGEKVAQYLTKGTTVEVVGTPSVRAWDNKGTPQASLECTVMEVKLHGGGTKDTPVADRGRATRGKDDMDSDIPF